MYGLTSALDSLDLSSSRFKTGKGRPKRGLVGSTSGQKVFEEIKISFLYQECNDSSLVLQPLTYSLYRLNYPGSLCGF
jgi:hypothetical protein